MISRIRIIYLLLLLLIIALPWLGSSACTGTALPYLQHIKHPLAATAVRLEAKNSYQLYVANADLDRLSVVDILQRTLVLDPSPTTPGIIYIPTGKRPIDLVTSPDQSTIFVLHSIDGNIRAYNTEDNKPLTDDQKQIIAMPVNCQRQPGCWKSPVRLLFYQQTSPSQTRGFVALNGENAIAIVDLDRSSKTFGHELQRVRLYSRPTDMWFNQKRDKIYISDGEQPFIHILDPRQLSVRRLDVGSPSLSGSTSPDDKWLYLIDSLNDGILIYDLFNEKLVAQGDQRYPKRTHIRLEDASFLRVEFISCLPISVVGSNGEQRLLTAEPQWEGCQQDPSKPQKYFAWANASDGYSYIIDPDEYITSDQKTKLLPHRILNADERAPSVDTAQLYLDGEGLGAAQNPSKTTLPKLQTSETNSSGIELFRGQTRTESWILEYEGALIQSQSGRFIDQPQGLFVDMQTRDFQREGVQVGDLLILEDCEASPAPDAGDIGEQPHIGSCEFPITKIEAHQLTIDLSKANLEQKAAWKYSLRTSKSYLVKGSSNGLLDSRAQENTPYSNHFFALTLLSGSLPTPRGLRLEFNTADAFIPKHAKLGGMPSRILPLPNHLACQNQLCSLERCQNHPGCQGKLCVPNSTDISERCNNEEDCVAGVCVPVNKIWILDPPAGRIFVINPREAIFLESTIQ